MPIFDNFVEKNVKFLAFGNFVEKNDNFCQIFFKKCQVFGNFLTFKRQFSGGLDSDLVGLISDLIQFYNRRD